MRQPLFLMGQMPPPVEKSVYEKDHFRYHQESDSKDQPDPVGFVVKHPDAEKAAGAAAQKGVDDEGAVGNAEAFVDGPLLIFTNQPETVQIDNNKK